MLSWFYLAGFTLCFTVSPVVLQEKANLDTLKFVHAIWRHGDRSPSRTFPTDVHNNESSWPQGFGELSTLGMQQQFQLGQWLRNRYNTFLSAQYSKYEIYVRSTSYNRTIMSALANMAGLYIPEGAQKWSQKIIWQPVPVHSRPREDDPTLWMDKPCPTEDKLYKEVQESEAVTKIEAENRHFLDFVSEKTKVQETPLRLDDIWTIYDPINCERRHNDTHVVPKWVNETVWEKLLELYDLSFKYYYFTPAIQRLRGGLLLGEILHRMQEHSTLEKEMKNRLKFYVYSAHDTTLGALLANLGNVPEKCPTYATVILVELHEKNGNHHVEVYYKNLTDKVARPLTVGDCGSPCSLEHFAQRSVSRIPPSVDDWYSECGVFPWYHMATPTYFVVVCILLAMLVFLLSILAVWAIVAMKSRRQGGSNLLPYSPVSQHEDQHA